MNCNFKVENLTNQNRSNQKSLELDEMKNNKGGQFYQPGGYSLKVPESPSYRSLGADNYIPSLGLVRFSGFTPGRI